MNPQTELTRRYPSRDFSAVFAFLASVPLLAERTRGTQVPCNFIRYSRIANIEYKPSSEVGRLGGLAQPKESKIKAGRNSYTKRVDNGTAKEHQAAAGRKGGLSKSFAKLLALAGARHAQHVKHNFVNPKCSFCLSIPL